MWNKGFAGVVGVLAFLFGFVGLFATTSQDVTNFLGVDINLAHSIAYMCVGAIGAIAYLMGYQASRLYTQIVAIVFLAAALAGAATQPFLGIVPLGGWGNELINIVAGLVGVAVGYGIADEETQGRLTRPGVPALHA